MKCSLCKCMSCALDHIVDTVGFTHTHTHTHIYIYIYIYIYIHPVYALKDVAHMHCGTITSVYMHRHSKAGRTQHRVSGHLAKTHNRVWVMMSLEKTSSPTCRPSVASKANPHYVHTRKLVALSPQQLQSSCPWHWGSNRGCKESLGLDRLPQDF